MREIIKISPCLTNRDLLNLKNDGYEIIRLVNGKFIAQRQLNATNYNTTLACNQ